MQIKLYNTTQAAEFIGNQKSTLEAWRCRGNGPKFLKIGRLVKYAEADLIAFINQNACQSTAEYKRG